MDDLGPKMSEETPRRSGGVGRWSHREGAEMLRSCQDGGPIDLVFMVQSVGEACQAFYSLSLVAEEASDEVEALRAAWGIHA